MKTNRYIVCIGGANVDIQGFSNAALNLYDSNPGIIELSAGGVGRNIAENLARMGLPVKMITPVGDDYYGKLILQSCLDCGMDTSGIVTLPEATSSAYISITNNDGDMYIALNDMAIMKRLDQAFIQSQHQLISHAALIVCDPNLTAEAYRYLTHSYRSIPIFTDAVSIAKSAIIKPCLADIHTLKANIFEAEALTGIRIRSQQDLQAAADNLLEAGTSRVAITLNKHGVYYKDHLGIELLRTPAQTLEKAVNATGAGDAFTAGLVFAYFHHLSLEDTLTLAMDAAFATLNYRKTIDPNIASVTRPFFQ